MHTNKNTIISICSIAFIAIATLILPSIVTLSMFISSLLLLGIYSFFNTINHNYDINYKYWLNFAGQLFALLFVSASFVMGLSFIADSIVV